MRALATVLALCISLGGCALFEPRPAPLNKENVIRPAENSESALWIIEAPRWRERYAYMYGYGPFGRPCTSFRGGWWTGGPPWSMCY